MVKKQRSQFKQYAKEAKERMSSGFWETRRERVTKASSEAEELGVNIEDELSFERSELMKMFYNREEYERDKRIYLKVCEIKRRGDTVINPIQVLCEMEGVDKLPMEKRTQKVLEISAKYREMVEKYEKVSRMKYDSVCFSDDEQ